jgi:hypothetical protein
LVGKPPKPHKVLLGFIRFFGTVKDGKKECGIYTNNGSFTN